MLLTIISFLLVLSVLVLVHEAGHFFVAKRLGVKVEEFGFGFPPRLFGKKIGETIYSINALPIGGFVKLYGEDDAGGGKIQIPNPKSQIPKTKDIKRAFFARPAWQRAVIVLAGVVMNFILAVIIISYLFSVVGVPTQGKNIIVGGIAKNSPAEKAGLHPGDIIVSVNNEKITSAAQVISITKKHLGEQVALDIIEKHTERIVNITPRKTYPKGEGAMGIVIGPDFITKKYPWYQAPFVGTKEALNDTWLNLQGLGGALFQFSVQHKVPQDIMGPIGIAEVTGFTLRTGGLFGILSLISQLSLSLAIMNILPIPALDGGRLFFILIELVSGRKVHPKFEAYAHVVGMAVLLTLIFLITLHDITNPIDWKKLAP